MTKYQIAGLVAFNVVLYATFGYALINAPKNTAHIVTQYGSVDLYPMEYGSVDLYPIQK